MKKFFKFAALLFTAAAMVLTGCKDVPEPEPPVDPFEGASLEVKLVGADITAATVSVKAEVLNVVSYIIKPVEGEMTAPTVEEIFAQGTMVALEKEGLTQVTLRNLEAETNYVTYWAGRISADKVWSEVKEFKFKTAAEPIIPVLTAKLGAVESTTAEIKVYAENVSRIAYVVKTAAEAQSEGAPSIQRIFATGKSVALESGDNLVTVTALSPNTEYVVYIAGEIAVLEEYMEEVITIGGIKTSDFAQDITVRDIHYRGFTVDVRVDPKIKEQNHMIKWATMSLYTYNSRGNADYFALNLHDTAWGGINLFNESRSLIIDEAHSLFDAGGGQMETYWEGIVPGQPQVVAMGEYRRGEHWGGYGMGYYRPMFDEDSYLIDQSKSDVRIDETPYWTGFYQRVHVQVQKPEPLPEDLVEVEITPGPADAQVKVWADESIDRVAIMIMSELEHGMASQAIDEEHMQWFATSLEASYAGVTMIVDPYQPEYNLNGTIYTALSEYFYDIPRESKYWVYVVGLRGDVEGDGILDGHEQVFKKYEFYLSQPTKPAPKLEVTALESTSPFEVSFNIKCPTKDAVKAKAISNYEKEWLMTGMSAQEIVDNYGIELGTLELLQINSDEGLIFTLPSRPNENNYLAAMVANDEGTETFSDAVIARSLPEPAADRVESALFESLKGEWTATATVAYSLYDVEQEIYVPQTATHTSKITIGDFEYPESLDEEAYEIFRRHGVDRATADAYYAEFKAAAKTFIDNTRAQNRILMNGFDFGGDILPYFQYADPYGLFISDTYNGYTSEMPLYDFGPKWYLEVAADGSVSAPFNVNYFTPMSSWYAENNAIYESHFIAYDPINGLPVGYMGDAEGNTVNGYFPVEISEDGNTITVKPLVHSGISYYPNSAVFYGMGQYSVSIAVISDVVLTRNTSSAVAPAKVVNKKKAGSVKKEMVKANQEIKTPARPMSRGVIGPKVEHTLVAGPKNFSAEERANQWIQSRRK